MARSKFLKAVLVSVLGTGMSRVLGAARDIAIASFLGAGLVSDAFLIAFTIPNTFRRFVADEGLTGALVPAIARAEAEEGLPAARTLANALLAALLLANALLITAGVLGAAWVVKAFAWSFTRNPEQFALTVSLTRWLFPFLAMVSVVSFAEGLLNHRGHFFLPKLAPGLVSAGIVASVLLLGGAFEQPVYALVVGVLVGGLAHVLMVVPPLLTRWGAVGLNLGFRTPRFRRVIKELGKVVLIGLFAQANILVLRQLAAFLETGTVTWYWNANRLVDLAQGMIAIAIGSALLPAVSQAVASEDWERFRHDLVGALRLAAFVLIPTSVGLAFFALPLTALVFFHGKYAWVDVQWTATTLALLTPFLLTVAGINILKKVFFALEERNHLLWVGALGVGLTGGLGWALAGRWQIAGLALALSASSALQLLIYVVLLWRRLGERLGLSLLLSPLGKMGLAAAPLVLWLVLVSGWGHWERGATAGPNLGLLIAGIAGAVLLYAGASWALGIEEFGKLAGMLRRRVGR
ncbi:MAG: murein biosynthesis integral membrane protein MurJ [Deltaproteobacteria bacterium]|nr:murein biosynthesis integral membrane protein MurJ [Deltaproteobacteria bacterium]